MLESLARLREGRTRRVSSWDRSGREEVVGVDGAGVGASRSISPSPPNLASC